MTLRTYLFAAADDEPRFDEALGCGVDAVILDLEDTVAVARKDVARRNVAEWVTRPRRCRLYVRVNALEHDWSHEDLEAAVRPGVDGIIMPKIESVADLATGDWFLGKLERRAGLPRGSLDLIPIVETALGMENITAIARHGARVRRLGLGAGDLTADLGMRWTRSEAELGAIRSRFTLASRAAGLEPPVDAVWLDLDDDAGLEDATARSVDYGFGGKFCLSPRQVQVVHRVLAPNEAERQAAERIVEAFRRSESRGEAVVVIEGRFVDYPIARAAQRVLDRVNGAAGAHAESVPATQAARLHR